MGEGPSLRPGSWQEKGFATYLARGGPHAHGEDWAHGSGEDQSWDSRAVCKRDPGRAGGPIALCTVEMRSERRGGGSRPGGCLGAPHSQPGPSMPRNPEETPVGAARYGGQGTAGLRGSLAPVEVIAGGSQASIEGWGWPPGGAGQSWVPLVCFAAQGPEPTCRCLPEGRGETRPGHPLIGVGGAF